MCERERKWKEIPLKAHMLNRGVWVVFFLTKIFRSTSVSAEEAESALAALGIRETAGAKAAVLMGDLVRGACGPLCPALVFPLERQWESLLGWLLDLG